MLKKRGVGVLQIYFNFYLAWRCLRAQLLNLLLVWTTLSASQSKPSPPCVPHLRVTAPEGAKRLLQAKEISDSVVCLGWA